MNLIDWIKKKREEDSELICANPECKKSILTREVAWIYGTNEFYHPRCVMQGIILKSFNSNEIVSGEVRYLQRERALMIKSKLEEISN